MLTRYYDNENDDGGETVKGKKKRKQRSLARACKEPLVIDMRARSRIKSNYSIRTVFNFIDLLGCSKLNVFTCVDRPKTDVLLHR